MDIIMEEKSLSKKSGPCSETDLRGHNNGGKKSLKKKWSLLRG